MRKREVKEIRQVVEVSVICDECGAECINTNFEILFKCSFSDKVEHYKDICFKCWEKNYKTKMLEQKNRDTDNLLKVK